MTLVTKSRYVAGLQCPQRLWLMNYSPTAASAATNAQSINGDEVGRASHNLYPNGVFVATSQGSHEAAVEQTRRLMADTATTAIFEAAFQANDVNVCVDILGRDQAGWRVIEVKSSSKPKPHHYDDIALQVFVLTRAGITVTGADLLHINSAYRRGIDGIQWDQLFARVDVTSEVMAKQFEVGSKLAVMRDILERGRAPNTEPGPQCTKPYPCEFTAHCLANKPSDWVGYLPNLSAKQALALRMLGIDRIPEVPEAFKLRGNQAIIRDVSISGKPHVGPDLRRQLRQFGPPACYIDFEAAAPSVPLYPHTTPYQPIPFQWSMHVRHNDGQIDHCDFLHDGMSDPRREFAETLLAATRINNYPVIVYSPYEASRLSELAETFSDLKPQLDALRDRLRDLLPVVRGNVYLPTFKFSNSIKYVASALSPGFSYDAVGKIKDGTGAANAYLGLASSLIHEPSAVKEVRQDLLAYCKNDTEAMVRVHRALLMLVDGDG